MTPQEFCYWLQGYFEVSGNETLTPEQVKMVKEHLQLTFNKVTTTTIHPSSLRTAWVDSFHPGISHCQVTNDKIPEYIQKLTTEFQIKNLNGNNLSYPFNGQTKEEYKQQYGYDPPLSC
jgi:hypothetical protein